MQPNKTELFGALCGLGGTITEAMDNNPGFVPCGHPAAVVMEALEVCGTDAASEDEIVAQTAMVQGFIEHVADHRGVSAHTGRVDALSEAETALAEKLIAAAPNTDPADPDAAQAFYRALAAIDAADASAVSAYLD